MDLSIFQPYSSPDVLLATILECAAARKTGKSKNKKKSAVGMRRRRDPPGRVVGLIDDAICIVLVSNCMWAVSMVPFSRGEIRQVRATSKLSPDRGMSASSPCQDHCIIHDIR